MNEQGPEQVPTAVYRFYDGDDRLLYVGITSDLFNRWRWHQQNSTWWAEQARIEVVWRSSRKIAEDEETEAVRRESPVHNIQKRGKTPIRTFRLDRETWDEFGKAAAFMGRTRTDIIRQMMQFAVGQPGVGLPERPPIDWRDQVKLAETGRVHDEDSDP